MKFFSMKTCKELVELGCISRSGTYYVNEGVLATAVPGGWIPSKDIKDCYHAFTLHDFVSPEDYARENARKLWGDCFIESTCVENTITVIRHDLAHSRRHQLIDSTDPEEIIRERVGEMKLTVYKCDGCKAVLSDDSEGIALSHLSINFNESSWVRKVDGLWKRAQIFNGIKQFCGVRCLFPWIEKYAPEMH